MVSTRRSTKVRQDSREDDNSGDRGKNHGPEEGSGPLAAQRPKPRASGKAASKQKGKRRNAAKLSKLPGMPLDVLYEILSLVNPVDLLRMSWASRAFRNVLTSKSSRQVWKATFDNVPEARRPPPCPEDLTEIAYANLLYNPCCMDCGAQRAPAYWRDLVRVCMGCIENWVTLAGGAEDQAVRTLSQGKLSSSCMVLPTLYIKIPPLPRRGLYVFTKGLKQLTADLEAVDDESAVVQRYEDALVAKQEFARLLETLEKKEKGDREAALTAARNGRIDQILERLADEGWGEEIRSHKRDYVTSIIQVKGVKVARPLTEKAWEEMEVRILDTMRTCQKEIEDRTLRARCTSRVNEVAAIVQKYRRTLGPHDFCPWSQDICNIPDIRKVIIDGTDEEFNTCTEEVTSRLPKLTSQILEGRTAKLSVLLPFGDRPDNVLLLATAWFKCSLCHLYPAIHGIDVLRHHCPLTWSPPSGKSAGEAAFSSYALGRGWCAENSKFTFAKAESNVARELILDCGEDPESITLAEINSKFHRFVFNENDELVAHNWEETFNYKCRNSSAYHRFLGPDEYPELVHDPDAYNEIPSWSCLRCWHHGTQISRIWRFVTFPAVKQHITDQHGVGVPIEGVDYFYDNRYRPPKFIRANQEPTPTDLSP